jgi:hypothetical protein
VWEKCQAIAKKVRCGEKTNRRSFLLFCYAVSESVATLGTARLILAAPRRNALINIPRGNLAREIFSSFFPAKSLRPVAGRNRFARLRVK